MTSSLSLLPNAHLASGYLDLTIFAFFLRPDEACNGGFGMRFVEEVQQIASDETCSS